MGDQATVRTPYRKLLAPYPQAFREQFGESMEQTFNDLCSERRQQTERGLFSLVLWLFFETATGILKEHLLQFRPGDKMKAITTNFRSPALISVVLVLPFMILQVVNRRNFDESFPFFLFGGLWLLQMAFFAILMPVMRSGRAGTSILANPLHLVFRVAFLVLIAMIWGEILIDQFPCFLGVRYCD